MLLTAVVDPAFDEDRLPAAMRGRMVGGSPERIAETVAARVTDVGIYGVVVNVPSFVPGTIGALGAALREVVGPR